MGKVCKNSGVRTPNSDFHVKDWFYKYEVCPPGLRRKAILDTCRLAEAWMQLTTATGLGVLFEMKEQDIGTTRDPVLFSLFRG